MRTIGYYTLLSLFLLLAVSCSDPLAQISLSKYSIILAPGDAAEIYVSGEADFEVKSADDNIVTVSRDGRTVVLTAHQEGTTDVLFISQLHNLSCQVIVKDSLMHDLDAILTDTTPRILGSGVSLVYGTPGIMITSESSQIEYIDIDTNERVSLVFDNGALSYVMINGVRKEVADCVLYKETNSKIWYLVYLKNDIEGFWAVLDRSYLKIP